MSKSLIQRPLLSFCKWEPRASNSGTITWLAGVQWLSWKELCLNQSSVNDFETEWYSKSAGSSRTRSRSAPVTTHLESRNGLRSGGWQSLKPSRRILDSVGIKLVRDLRKANAAPFGSGKEMQNTSLDESQPCLWDFGSWLCFAQRLIDQDLETAESRFKPYLKETHALVAEVTSLVGIPQNPSFQVHSFFFSTQRREWYALFQSYLPVVYAFSVAEHHHQASSGFKSGMATGDEAWWTSRNLRLWKPVWKMLKVIWKKKKVPNIRNVHSAEKNICTKLSLSLSIFLCSPLFNVPAWKVNQLS